MTKAVELLLERIIKEEDAARCRYLKAVSDRDASQRNLNAINDFRATYTGELNDAGARGMTSSTLTQYNNFIRKLDKASEDQVVALQRADNMIEQARQQWNALQTKRKGLEKLLENEALAIRKAQDKAEQKMMDESALHIHLRNQRNGGSF